MQKPTKHLRILPTKAETSRRHLQSAPVRQNMASPFAMKKNALFLAGMSMVCTLFLSPPAGGTSMTLWIAPTGDDTHAGSESDPLASVAAAWEKFRDRPTTATSAEPDHLQLILRGGLYPLSQPLTFHAPDFTAGTASVTIAAAPGEHPVLSGGRIIGGWEKMKKNIPGLPAQARGQVWQTDAPKINGQILRCRQLWVNDVKAIRAREPNGVNLARLVCWNKTNQVAVIPSTALAGVENPGQLEMIVDQVWEIANLRVAKIRRAGTNAFLTFRSPESRLEFGHPWPPVIVTTNYHAPFFLANALEFLDTPGEWFEDVAAGKIYYWPRAGEDPATATIIAPLLETLVKIEGTASQRVTNLTFQDITFSHTGWQRPAEAGHVPLQAGMFLLDAKKLSPRGTSYHPGLDNLAWIGRPPAAVRLENSSHIAFEHCTFSHLAAGGVEVASGAEDDLISRCTFRDVGGNGIQLGTFSATNVETHVPYRPADEREICQREKILNNLFTDCGNEDWGCVGIAVGYAREITIAHNELCELPYTGISVGWGWTKMTNVARDHFIFANYIHHVGRKLGDLGGIYTLSAQPGTVIAENVIADLAPSPFVSDPQHWFYLYLDEGSSGITVRDNWCPTEKFLANANGPGNIWTNNGPQVSTRIRNAAGRENISPQKNK